MREVLRAAVVAVFLIVPSLALARERADRDTPAEPHADWRRGTLETMRVAVGNFAGRTDQLRVYREAGFNALVVFDADSFDATRRVWNAKSEEQVASETGFARQNGLPLIVGLEVEPFEPAGIAQASDDEIRARVELWKKYGDDLIVGVSPWYDDTFYDHVPVERQRHVYALLKSIARRWYVFGMVGEFGYDASRREIDAYYDPAAFDHLIVLMYPFNVGTKVTGLMLDNVNSLDPDGDIAWYVDRFMTRMEENFFSRLRPGQLIVLVVQAFSYPTDPLGHVPRANDVAIMTEHGNELIRRLPGQRLNRSAAYCCWGDDASDLVGLSERPDWINAVREVNDEFERNSRDVLQP